MKQEVSSWRVGIQAEQVRVEAKPETESLKEENREKVWGEGSLRHTGDSFLGATVWVPVLYGGSGSKGWADILESMYSIKTGCKRSQFRTARDLEWLVPTSTWLAFATTQSHRSPSPTSS